VDRRRAGDVDAVLELDVGDRGGLQLLDVGVLELVDVRARGRVDAQDVDVVGEAAGRVGLSRDAVEIDRGTRNEIPLGKVDNIRLKSVDTHS
jgi:hypothetical protein